MRWQVGGGVGRMSSSSTGDELAAQYTTPALADVYIEVDLRIPTPDTEGAGFILRGSNLREREGLDWHYYHIGIRPGERAVEFGLLTEGNQDVETLDSCRLPPSLSSFSDFRRLRVEATGAQFRVFVDGTYICEWEDGMLPDPGLTGLFVGVVENLSSKGEAVVEFARLRAYAPASAPSAAVAPVATPTSEARATTIAAGVTEPVEGIFEDNFSSTKGGWTTGSAKNGEVRIVDGVLLIRNLTDASYREESTPGIWAADVVLEVDSWLVDGTDDNWHALFCRRTETGAYYSAMFSADGYYAALLRVESEVVREQKPTSTDMVNQGLGAVNHAKLSCVGSQIRFWVNDMLLIDWTDDRLAEGEFGLAVTALDGDYSEGAFDNFVATFTGASDKQSPADLEASTSALQAIVTAPTLNVREGPGASYAKVGTVRAGERLPVLDSNTGCTWVKVVTPTTVGWISASYATLTGACGEIAPQATPDAPQPRPTVAVTPAATRSATAPASPLIMDFEVFGTWQRGDETWGEFRQSDRQVYAGKYAGALTYDFPANIPGDRNYVVFLRSIPIAGEPDALEMQVYGDGSGNLLNAWVKDATGQVWQFSFGQISHTGWKRMIAPLDTTLEWPVQPVGGNATALKFPVSFHALVLDYPTSDAAAGVIYFDEAKALYE